MSERTRLRATPDDQMPVCSSLRKMPSPLSVEIPAPVMTNT